MFKTADSRYAIGAMVSWPVYGGLYIAMLKVFESTYAAASGISWILSYAIVYAFQKYGEFGTMSRQAMLREIANYALAVVGLSARHGYSLALAVCAACDLSLRIGEQVLTFRIRAWLSFAPPTCGMPLGRASGFPRTVPGGRVIPRF